MIAVISLKGALKKSRRKDKMIQQITEECIKKAKHGDQIAFNEIIKYFEPELKKMLSKYYITGSEYEDVLQEGRIGLWKAVQDFDSKAGMSFKNFAINLVCKRHIITSISAARRKKCEPLNNAIEIDRPADLGDDSGSLLDFFKDPSNGILDAYILKEEARILSNLILSELTSLEKSIFEQYDQEASYHDIAEILGVSTKCVDNALLRVRRKGVAVYKKYREQCEKEQGILK